MIEAIHLLVFQNKETLSLIKPASKLGEKPVIENFSALDITNQLSLGGTKWQELCKQQSIKKMAYSILIIFSSLLQSFGLQTCEGLVYMLNNHVNIPGKSKEEFSLTDNVYLISFVLQKYSIFDVKMKELFIKKVNKLLINENSLKSFHLYPHVALILSDVLISYKDMNKGNLYINFNNFII